MVLWFGNGNDFWKSQVKKNQNRWIQLLLQTNLGDMKMRVRQTTRNNMVWRTRNFRKIHLKIEPSEIMLWLEEKGVPDSLQPISIRPVIIFGFGSGRPKG